MAFHSSPSSRRCGCPTYNPRLLRRYVGSAARSEAEGRVREKQFPQGNARIITSILLRKASGFRAASGAEAPFLAGLVCAGRRPAPASVFRATARNHEQRPAPGPAKPPSPRPPPPPQRVPGPESPQIDRLLEHPNLHQRHAHLGLQRERQAAAGWQVHLVGHEVAHHVAAA